MKLWVQVIAAKSIGKSIADNFCESSIGISIVSRKYRYPIVAIIFASILNKPGVAQMMLRCRGEATGFRIWGLF